MKSYKEVKTKIIIELTEEETDLLINTLKAYATSPGVATSEEKSMYESLQNHLWISR